jgi:hypothetical protein
MIFLFCNVYDRAFITAMNCGDWGDGFSYMIMCDHILYCMSNHFWQDKGLLFAPPHPPQNSLTCPWMIFYSHGSKNQWKVITMMTFWPLRQPWQSNREAFQKVPSRAASKICSESTLVECILKVTNSSSPYIFHMPIYTVSPELFRHVVRWWWSISVAFVTHRSFYRQQFMLLLSFMIPIPSYPNQNQGFSLK